MYPRFVEQRVREALSDTRVVLICGPRQSGKTTLAQRIAGTALRFVTRDDATTLNAALRDPVGFLRNLDGAVIDEIQRAPDLILAIKTTVDADPRPGRFLLTGSANLMTLPRVADSLARPHGNYSSAALGPGGTAEGAPILSRQGFCGADSGFPDTDRRRRSRGNRCCGRLSRGNRPFRMATAPRLAPGLHRGNHPARCQRHHADRSTGVDAAATGRARRTFSTACKLLQLQRTARHEPRHRAKISERLREPLPRACAAAVVHEHAETPHQVSQAALPGHRIADRAPKTADRRQLATNFSA